MFKHKTITLILITIVCIFGVGFLRNRTKLTEKKPFKQATNNTKDYRALKTNIKTEVDGVQRQYYIFIPPNPSKLLVILHGGGGSYNKIDNSTELSDRLKTDSGVVLVYPDAIDKNWNDGRLDDTGKPLRNANDSEFITQIIDKYQSEYNISPQNTTLGGISNGAIFSNYYGCGASNVSKLFLVVGNMPVTDPFITNCANSSVQNILALNSKIDPIIKFDGGRVGLRGGLGEVLSVEKTSNIWSSSGKNIKNITLTQEGHVWPTEEVKATDLLLDLVK
jgi:poly(3-hydroxybutyrate) depolymerase